MVLIPGRGGKDIENNQQRLKHIFAYIEYDNLTDWEQDFVESVSDQFEENGSLPERQLEILEKIFRERAV